MSVDNEHFGPGTKKPGRGMAQRSLDLIEALIEPVAWERCDRVNKAEQELLKTILDAWKPAR